MSPDLNALALFVSVVENKSFSEAAKCLGIPISTISRKISELEKSIDVRLLERTTRNLRLTDIGQEYYEYCRRGLDEFETGTLMIHDKQSEISGTLRLSAPPNLANILIAPMVCAFQTEYPKVNIKVFISERNLDLIEDGIDVTLRVGELEDSNLIAREIIQYRHRLVASKDYLAASAKLKQPSDLIHHRIITFADWYTKKTWKLTNRGKTQTVSVNGSLSINDYAGIIYAVEHNQGIAEIPDIICHSHIKSGRLIEILPNWHLQNTKLSIVYPSNRNVSRMVRLFIDFCIQQVKEWHTA